MMRIRTELSNQIRGVMKTFGLVVPPGRGGAFELNVRELLDGNEALSRIIMTILEAWLGIRKQAAKLGRQLIATAR